MGDLNMNGQLLRGLPTESRPVYDGDEAVSWAQLTRHIQHVIRPFATRGYVDEKCADLAVRLRHKPVISLTTYPVVRRPPFVDWVFSEFKGYTVEEALMRMRYEFLFTGRIIRICTTSLRDETIKTQVLIARGDGTAASQKHVIIKENTQKTSEAVSIEFNFGNSLHLHIIEGVEHIFINDRVTLLLELDL